MERRKLSLLDQLIDNADQVLRTLGGDANQAARPSPADSTPEPELSEPDRRHAATSRVHHRHRTTSGATIVT